MTCSSFKPVTQAFYVKNNANDADVLAMAFLSRLNILSKQIYVKRVRVLFRECFMGIDEGIDAFLKGKVFAVVGASKDRSKYGNKVLRCYLQHGLKVYAVNPKESEIEGQVCVPNLAALPEPVHGVSVITPPHITEKIVQEVAEAGIHHVWMQPGAESEQALDLGDSLGLNVIGDGSCLLVVLGYREQ
jgi:predicted CoA-binding protein